MLPRKRLSVFATLWPDGEPGPDILAANFTEAAAICACYGGLVLMGKVKSRLISGPGIELTVIYQEVEVIPWRPTTSGELLDFERQFCLRCERHFEDGRICPIKMRALMYPPNSAEFPNEWVLGEDGPICLVFREKTG